MKLKVTLNLRDDHPCVVECKGEERMNYIKTNFKELQDCGSLTVESIEVAK